MEEILNLVTGIFKVNIDKTPQEDEDDDDEMQFLAYKDVNALGSGAALVQYCKPKRANGNLIDIQSRSITRVAGNFHLQDPWWQLTILRTRKNKAKITEPKDFWSLCYRLRDDNRTVKDNVVHLFLSKVQEMVEGKDKTVAPWFYNAREKFYIYLRERGQYGNLDLCNLEERIEAYLEHFPEDEIDPKAKDFKSAVLHSTYFLYMKVYRSHPQTFHYLSQLFPGHFIRLIGIDHDKMEKLATLIDENPGYVAFKDMLKKHCGLLGMESSSQALINAGLMRKVPTDVADAIHMYEYLKRVTREDGHTCVNYLKIIEVLGVRLTLCEDALKFLNINKITHTVVENGQRLVYLMYLWKAEKQIAKGISNLIKFNLDQPWKLKVDWEKEDFTHIKADNDQMRAARLIAEQPVVVISGKGGCGKTYVVTKVITSATVERENHNVTSIGGDTTNNLDDNRNNNGNDSGGDNKTSVGRDGDLMQACGAGVNDLTQAEENSQVDECSQAFEYDDQVHGMETDEKDNQKHPVEIKMLLTAPTGKAANLLGKRAGEKSYTLHQVIYSYRLHDPALPWQHEDVNTLVVDECSLVSVTTFSFLIEILLKHAKLRKIVLLGDIRQLPSIEPGNFLADTFSSLHRLGCSVELRTNHRAESQMIVDNATRISKKIYPLFDEEKFLLRKLPESNGPGNDYMAQDISEEVRRMLTHPALHSQVTSQFISFTRNVCDSINDLCCVKYSDHRIKDTITGQYVFQTGDKICCTKNGYVKLYREGPGGRLVCLSQKSAESENEENSEGGGVSRLVTTEIEISTQNKTLNQSTVAGSLLDETAAGPSDKAEKKKKAQEEEKIRLCNGEIFFILDEKEIKNEKGEGQTFLQLSDKDVEQEFIFWVDKREMKKMCKIRHAWARTIHTFQGSEADHVIYIVGSRTWRQNWQHVYTAVTRGRKSVFIVGQETTLRNAVKRSEIKRQTGLKKLLLEMMQKNKATSAIVVNPGSPMKSQITAKDLGHQPVQKLFSPSNQPTWKYGQKHGTPRSLDTTTDILRSLADEHDMLDIEEYDSDSSNTLVTSIKSQAPVAHRPGGNIGSTGSVGRSAPEPRPSASYCGQPDTHDHATDEDVMAVDDGSGAESDDSQSLLSPPVLSKKTNSISSHREDNRPTTSVHHSTVTVPGVAGSIGHGNTIPSTNSDRLHSQTSHPQSTQATSVAESEFSSRSHRAYPPQRTSSFGNQDQTKGNHNDMNDLDSDDRTDSGTESESDENSQSLLTPPSGISFPVRRHASDSRTSSSIHSQTPTSQTPSNPHCTHQTTPGGIQPATTTAQSRLNLHRANNKVKYIPVVTHGDSAGVISGTSYVTPVNSRSAFTRITPSSTRAGRTSISQTNVQGLRSPLTPNTPMLFEDSGHKMKLNSNQNQHKNSTPLTDNSCHDLHSHIRTGLSPLEPGYNESSYLSSLPGFRKSLGSPHSPVDRISPGPPGFLERPCSVGSRRISDIQEPKSNESVQSQWSEIDESDYVRLADDSGVQLNTTGTTKHRESTDSPVTSLNLLTPAANRHLKVSPANITSANRRISNISAVSQWSEVDEEQYANLTLDLDDIQTMATTGQSGKSPAANTSPSVRPSGSTNYMYQHASPYTPSHSNQYREPKLLTSPDHSSKTAIIQDTPPKSSASDNRSILSPRKRPFPHHDNGVSPLKGSIAKLKFT